MADVVPQTKSKETSTSVYKYTVGFLLSLILTFVAFTIADMHLHGAQAGLTRQVLLPLLGGIALIQAVVQLIFFLHIGREKKPRWQLGVLAFMLLIVGIIVVGSLWIMDNLNYRMTPQQVNSYLKGQDGL